ncbi:hypothetical protein LSH36_175g01034 [Paralvinella palmiformis]|uniref:RNA ligase 1 n=1 Tax=Paralvinella palmiformis TaxID=53620 RepID=A0AAD9JT42_9ANNE|nr:hypothetical protein LSH36_175g01034 [Paralvinella palmiformis]
MLCNVQQKIPCVFETVILEGSSAKRQYQQFNVLAGDIPWLWARHDIKPNKAGLRKQKQKGKLKHFTKCEQNESQCSGAGEQRPTSQSDATDGVTILWDLEKDFKTKPAEWIPASGVKLVDGVPQPDDNGHIPGWVPVDAKSRQHCWHLSVVNLEKGFAFILQRRDDHLEIVTCDMAELCGCTLELIGTNVNGNPYKLGCKQIPLHLLIRHGSIPISADLLIDRSQLARWFVDCEDGKIEGIVWHCGEGQLFKIHRHHLQLPWPVDDPKLSMLPVTIRISHTDDEPNALFKNLSDLNNSTFSSLMVICK